ncbi:hypothetical protein [Hwangdonia lutea]|uniref:Nuclear transport factor 2 family protein n=1 Tax=Hwangdonia lutea TaxID=3075823 RepID=A0AA97EK35_9FLAO|nr:hypothetical protein [Hwangdonia sp. SCSIO 19198]WOD42914.1 hypothetical protein RNZ46_13040 [Hwangdonia sp. SCSIO 19198]
MKKIFIITFMIFSASIVAQEYSSKKVEKLIDKLYDYSTESFTFNDEINYMVVDNWTQNIVYKNKKYVDNKIHKVFLKIIRKSKIEDLILMSTSDFPNIRVYAFWALIRNDEKELANNVLKGEKGKEKGKVWFDSFGDLILDYTTTDLMKELVRLEGYRKKKTKI